MDLGLNGKACVVTGSTGGIGLETAKLLVAEGARVVTSGRGEAPAIGEALHVRADLSEADAPARLVEAAVDELGGLDVLVNNVGYAVQARFEDVPDEDWDAMWQLNVMSYVRAIRAALPHLRTSRGVIVNVSSTSGKRPSAAMPHYSVTKAAVLSLSRLVADLYAGDGIRCNAVTPGPTATEAWLGEGGLADQQGGEPGGGAREGRRRPAARPARRAGGDRIGDRVSRIRAGVLCHRRRLVGGRRHRPDHHLETCPKAPTSARDRSGDCPRTCLDRTCPRVNLPQHLHPQPELSAGDRSKPDCEIR